VVFFEGSAFIQPIKAIYIASIGWKKKQALQMSLLFEKYKQVKYGIQYLKT